MATRAHEGAGAGQAPGRRRGRARITATTDRRVFVRGIALDEAIGVESFPSMLLRLWRGDAATEAEASLLGACLVAAIDHGPLAPSALVVRTIASTRATPMSALAGGILSFGELHGAVVTAGHDDPGHAARPTATSRRGPMRSSQREREAGRRLPGIGHRWHEHDLRAERLLDLATEHGAGRARGGRARPRRAGRRARRPPGRRQHRRRRWPWRSRRSGSTRSTATSCSRSRAASGWRPTSSRSARGSARCG